jgi:nucleotide-binding universal stress UspA family protein
MEAMRGTIVVGYDGSDAARRAVLRAGEVAAGDGQVVVVTVASAGLPPGLEDPATEASSADEAATLLHEARELLRNGHECLAVTTHSETGDAADALIRAAREAGAELIVVGAHGRSFVARALLGSVAEKLVKRAPCDVLVTR